MKIIGTGSFDANVTTTTNSLAAALLTRPEISVNVANLFEKNFSTFSSYLARRGLVKKNIFPDMSSPSFRTLGNKKFMWPLKSYPFRKGKIAAAITNLDGTEQLGTSGKKVMIVPLDTQYFSPNDVLNIGPVSDKLQFQNLDEYPEPSDTDGIWNYKMKLVTNVEGAYVNPNKVTVNTEVGFSHTAFPEMSETGYEKNTFFEWHTNNMTIQRMAYSISGSALHTVLWIEHNKQRLWVGHQDMQMMERIAFARENQLIDGQATIDANDNVYVNDLKNRDIIQGDGILNQGLSALKFHYNKLSVKVLERIMENLQLLSNTAGEIEVLVVGGQKFVGDFMRIMRDVFKYNPEPLFTGGNERGVDATFYAYRWNGVKLVVAWNPGFNAQFRPIVRDMYGVSLDSYRAIFCSLGNTIGGDPNIELVTLGASGQDRSFVKKVIDGMASLNEKGNSPSGRSGYASNSMDGVQVQALWETGVKVANPFGIAELIKPRA